MARQPDGSHAYKRFFWFSYQATDREKRAVRTLPDAYHLHQVRDGIPFSYLQAALLKARLNYGGILFNVADPNQHRQPPGGRSVRADEPVVAFNRGDLLLLVTRPPINDLRLDAGQAEPPMVKQRDERREKHIDRSHTWLEHAVLSALRSSALPKCSRRFVRIGFGDKSSIFTFNTNGKADLLESRRPSQTTVGFAMHIPDIQSLNGCGVLAVFGMGGIESLVWTLSLSRNTQVMRRLLNRKCVRVLLGEFRIPRTAGRANSDLSVPLSAALFRSIEPQLKWREL